MSHFRVAVFQTPTSPDVEMLMSPYDENIEVAPYIDMTCDEALARGREITAKAKERMDAGVGDKWDAKRAAHADDPDDELLDWLADWYEQNRDGDGNFLTTYNPRSKWDYYSEIDTYTFDEWLRSGTDMTEEELRREWKVRSTRGDGFYSKEYYTKTYGDEDTFVKTCQLPDGWAVVTPDGKWHEPGKVGWWGMDSSTPDSHRDWVEHFHERFVEPYDPKATTVVMMDCHI